MLAVIGVLAAVACVEDVTSPPICPDYCPGGRIVTVESVLTGVIVRDSSFRDYVRATEAGAMLAMTTPEIDSRPIFQTPPIATRSKIDTGSDTTTGPIVIDSARLTLTWLRRDTITRNVRLELYRLPLGLDSTTTLAAVAPSFVTPIKTVNLDSLLAVRRDSVTGDTILSVDSLRRVVAFSLKFDSAHAPYTVADSGKVALGVRVTADSSATLVLGTSDGGEGPRITWYNRVDSAGTLIARSPQQRTIEFDTFVSNVTPVAFGSDLVVGGVPATRALLRFALPRSIRDSAQIIRATLVLVPTGSPGVLMGDSVFVRVSRVAADLGAKSPIAPDTIGASSSVFVSTGSDTVRIEVTTLLRFWQFDTTSASSAYLRLLALDRRGPIGAGGLEGATFTSLRLSSSRTAGSQPALRLTYVPRIKFGAP